MLIGFALEKDKNCYPQVFLKEWRYIENEIKLIRYITGDLEKQYNIQCTGDWHNVKSSQGKVQS